MTQIRDSG